MGLHVDSENNHLYSISEDGTFKVTDLNNQNILTSIIPGKSGIKYLLYSKEREAFIIADGDGIVYVY